DDQNGEAADHERPDNRRTYPFTHGIAPSSWRPVTACYGLFKGDADRIVPLKPACCKLVRWRVLLGVGRNRVDYEAHRNRHLPTWRSPSRVSSCTLRRTTISLRIEIAHADFSRLRLRPPIETVAAIG